MGCLNSSNVSASKYQASFPQTVGRIRRCPVPFIACIASNPFSSQTPAIPVLHFGQLPAFTRCFSILNPHRSMRSSLQLSRCLFRQAACVNITHSLPKGKPLFAGSTSPLPTAREICALDVCMPLFTCPKCMWLLCTD